MVATNETLLERLKADEAHEAWRQFYDLYWSAILRYAYRLGLNEVQAQDALQETMVTLMRVLPEFAYDRSKGRFRNFLMVIVRNRALGVMRRARRQQGLSLDEGKFGDCVAAEIAEADEVKAVGRWKESLMEDALMRLRADRRLGRGTWEVFQAYVIEQQPAPEIARRFGLKENAVYQIRARLLRRLRADVELRMRDSGSDPD